ncbi:hypothetical protein DL95DRAFT_184721 [Leptodontidium sp. 2 PMI_412]|nr:hypothetical protein DL95DRAFT_184721 [Leptodontidium sp. 2 PMI_412]
MHIRSYLLCYAMIAGFSHGNSEFCGPLYKGFKGSARGEGPSHSSSSCLATADLHEVCLGNISDATNSSSARTIAFELDWENVHYLTVGSLRDSSN